MEVSRRAQSIKASSTLAISAKAAELKVQGKDMVTFGVGEPDFDTPAHIREAAKKAIDEGKTRYTPAAGTPALRKAVCDKLKKDNGLDYEPAQVVISNGAKHSLMNAFMAILNEGDEVIIPAPFWLSYAEMVKIAGGVPVVVHTKKENNFMLTKEELKFKTAFMAFAAEEYTKRNWAMQLHYGCKRDNNAARYAQLGPDTGYDCINNYAPSAQMADFLNALNEKKQPSKDDYLQSESKMTMKPIGNDSGCFQDAGVAGKIQQGSAWWFNDHKTGMIKQMTSLAKPGTSWKISLEC